MRVARLASGSRVLSGCCCLRWRWVCRRWRSRRADECVGDDLGEHDLDGGGQPLCVDGGCVGGGGGDADGGAGRDGAGQCGQPAPGRVRDVVGGGDVRGSDHVDVFVGFGGGAVGRDLGAGENRNPNCRRAHGPWLDTRGCTAAARHHRDASRGIVTVTDDRRVTFTLTCDEVDECRVAFEPDGSVHPLRRDDALDVEIAGPGSGRVEITFVPDGFIVGAWAGSETSARNWAGESLAM